MYSDTTTGAMKLALEETDRRREIQAAYNKEHNITPASTKKNILDMSAHLYDDAVGALPMAAEGKDDLIDKAGLQKLMRETEKAMVALADEMEFEKAAIQRDRLMLLKEMDLGVKPPSRALLEAARGQAEKPAGTGRRQPRKYRRRR
jgi:excinuclease ABC subunit B